MNGHAERRDAAAEAVLAARTVAAIWETHPDYQPAWSLR